MVKKKVNVFVNNKKAEVLVGSTVLQACELVNIEIPRFCFHERLLIAGNCRMCLVEIEKSPKPVASCSMPVAEGMKIFTDSPLVKKAREGVLEFLLLNHPLDCPVCDQGGECDLQDQTYQMASERSRFFSKKRSVEDHYYGVLIKTVMTRCIHCTRCVRFATEIAGVPVLGSTLRGRETEIGSYVDKVFDSELSGNIIDLCPVGALTSKPYAFTVRPWELRSVNGVDIHDGLGSNIRIDFSGNQIKRVLPRLNENINEEWISDKIRFSYDGLNRQRINEPMLKVNNSLKISDWSETFKTIKKKLNKNIVGNKIGGLVNPETDLQTALLFKSFLLSLGSNKVGFSSRFGSFNQDFLTDYTFNSKLSGVDNADLCLLVGVNLRKEAAVFNSRLRKRYLDTSIKVFYIGETQNNTFKTEHIGSSYKSLIDLVEGRSMFLRELFKAKNPIIILGSHIFSQKSGHLFYKSIKNLLQKNGLDPQILNVLQDTANITGLLNLGLKPISKKDLNNLDLVIGLNSDSADFFNLEKNDRFFINLNYQGNSMLSDSDVILAGSSFTEQNALFSNTENRVQKTEKAVSVVGNARRNSQIFEGLGLFLNKSLNTNLSSYVPWHKDFNLTYSSNFKFPELEVKNKISKKLTIFGSRTPDFYLTNNLTKHSKTMLLASKNLRKPSNFLNF